MTDGIAEQLITQNISALSMAIAFLYFLSRKNKETKDTLDKFNETINNHLVHALSTEEKMTGALQALSNAIGGLNDRNEKKKG